MPLIQHSVVREQTLLKVEHDGKELHFVEKQIEKTYVTNSWRKASFSWNNMLAEKKFGKEYEMRWKNFSSQSFGRTIFIKSDGKPMNYTQAIKNFFEAVKASEKVNFTPIDNTPFQSQLEL